MRCDIYDMTRVQWNLSSSVLYGLWFYGMKEDGEVDVIVMFVLRNLL